MDEKIKISVSKYDPDYYVMVGEAWIPKNQHRISADYRRGSIVNLPDHDKTEILAAQRLQTRST
jgi:hypothetical protein